MIVVKLEGISIDLHFGNFDIPPTESRIGENHKKRKNKTSYICINNDQIVGALVVGRSRSGKTVRSDGTIVRSSYRKEGVARDLWKTMLKTEQPQRMCVRVVSDKGYSLVESMKEKFPKVKWLIDKDGSRKLRRMSYK
ncbi:hypothetical protein LCGC14_1145430 [marine sediment metagenome]|uniref:Uncharacterized protein n=1 Tax=marine sediment metagenome TaxID=412755 RepID=A0A0F9LX17_9ZZZZ